MGPLDSALSPPNVPCVRDPSKRNRVERKIGVAMESPLSYDDLWKSKKFSVSLLRSASHWHPRCVPAPRPCREPEALIVCSASPWRSVARPLRVPALRLPRSRRRYSTGATLRLSSMSPPGGERFSSLRVILVTWPTVTKPWRGECTPCHAGATPLLSSGGSANKHLDGADVVGPFFGKRQRTVPSQIFIEGHFG